MKHLSSFSNGATQGEFLEFHLLKTFDWEKTKRTLERQKQRQMFHYFSSLSNWLLRLTPLFFTARLK